jgi:hypothetical protein
VTDTTGVTATTTVSVPKAVYLLDIDSGGAGIGILTTAPTSGLEIGAATSITGNLSVSGTSSFAGAAYFTGGVYPDGATGSAMNDYVIASNYTTNMDEWSWVRFKNGLAICWGGFTFNVEASTSFGVTGLYRTSSYVTYSLPITFSTLRSISASALNRTTVDGWVSAVINATDIKVRMITPNKDSAARDYGINLLVIGRSHNENY